jgi:hypothetical protein
VAPEVDLEREEVLRVTVRGDAGARVEAVAENSSERVVQVAAGAHRCNRDTHLKQLEIIVPRGILPARLHVRRAPGTQCERVRTVCDLPDYRTPPPGSRPVAYRTLPTGQANESAPLAVFDRPSDYRAAPVAQIDFERESVVRLGGRQNASIRVAWIAETASEILIGVGETSVCTAYPSPPQRPIDLAIPATTKAINVAGFDEGPPCRLSGQG